MTIAYDDLDTVALCKFIAETNKLTIFADLGGMEKKKEFSVEKGRIDVSVRYGGKMLVMKFVRK